MENEKFYAEYLLINRRDRGNKFVEFDILRFGSMIFRTKSLHVPICLMKVTFEEARATVLEPGSSERMPPTEPPNGAQRRTRTSLPRGYSPLSALSRSPLRCSSLIMSGQVPPHTRNGGNGQKGRDDG